MVVAREHGKASAGRAACKVFEVHGDLVETPIEVGVLAMLVLLGEFTAHLFHEVLELDAILLGAGAAV